MTDIASEAGSVGPIFDLFDTRWSSDPFPLYAELRERTPIHHCLGAPLARMEAEVALSTLVRRAPRLSLASDAVTYKTNVVLRGMESMQVLLGE